MTTLTIIGRAELIDLSSLKLSSVPAKIDTGADNSAIWASHVDETPEGLECIFFGPDSPFYTGEQVLITQDYSVTRIANSFGHKEMRYKIKLPIYVKNRRIRATFTLADRSQKTYPVLLGRRLLKGKFLVDVAQGEPLHEAEKRKSLQLKQELAAMQKRKVGA